MKFKDDIQEKVLGDLRTKGISIIPNFLNDKDCQLIDNKLHEYPNSAFDRRKRNSYFLNFQTDEDVFNKCPFFACPELIKIIASDSLMSISDEYSSSQTYLKDTFSYRLSNKVNIFPWHIDNYNVLTKKKDSFNQLVFLLYLTSTKSRIGGTEFLLGSQELALKSEITKLYWDINDKNIKNYKSFYVPPEAGKLVISLAHIIHRGGKNTGVSNNRFNRSILRWQTTDQVDGRTIHYIPTHYIAKDIKSRLFLAGNIANNIPSSLDRNSENYPTYFLINTIIIALQNLIIKPFKPLLKLLVSLKGELKRSSKRSLIKKIIRKIF